MSAEMRFIVVSGMSARNQLAAFSRKLQQRPSDLARRMRERRMDGLDICLMSLDPEMSDLEQQEAETASPVFAI
jgi:hypothetical protein